MGVTLHKVETKAMHMPTISRRFKIITCMNFIPTILKPLASNLLIISPMRPRWTPSGLTAMKVRSLTMMLTGVRYWAKTERRDVKHTSIERQPTREGSSQTRHTQFTTSYWVASFHHFHSYFTFYLAIRVVWVSCR